MLTPLGMSMSRFFTGILKLFDDEIAALAWCDTIPRNSHSAIGGAGGGSLDGALHRLHARRLTGSCRGLLADVARRLLRSDKRGPERQRRRRIESPIGPLPLRFSGESGDTLLYNGCVLGCVPCPAGGAVGAV